MKVHQNLQDPKIKCRRVLIVDDDKDFAKSLRLILDRQTRDSQRSAHYEIETAHNSATALDIIQAFPAQVAVLDVRLGFDSGINLINKFKNINPEIRCIMLTAFASLDTSIKAFQEGADDYLRKPLHPSELFSALDRCFEKIYLENEKRLSDAALRNSEARMRAILDNTIDGFVTINEQGVIESFNKSAEYIFGHQSKDVIGQNVKALMPEPYRGQHDEYIQNYLRTGKSKIIGIGLEVVGLRRDKTEFPVDLMISEVNLDQRRIFIGVVRDLTERKQWEKNLNDSREHLRALSNRLQTIREEERTKIARNVHDEIGQDLVALQMDLSMLETMTSPEDSAVREKIDMTRKLAINILQKAETIATELRPAVLDVLGLPKALEWHMNDFKARTGINYHFHEAPALPMLDKENATALFRIFQEAVSNVGRHARADKVNISLKHDQNCILLEIKDNGKGISEQQIQNINSLGILGMQERARMLGGTCEIRRINKEGTCVTIKLPTPKHARHG